MSYMPSPAVLQTTAGATMDGTCAPKNKHSFPLKPNTRESKPTAFHHGSSDVVIKHEPSKIQKHVRGGHMVKTHGISRLIG